MDTKTNIFFHAPKELTTDAFVVWLFYFVDSNENYKSYKQTLFDDLILKDSDKGRSVSQIKLTRQENNVDVLLSFCFEDNEEKHLVLFEDKTWSMPHDNQLHVYKSKYSKCYRYFYYKLGYINFQEQKEISKEQYEVIDVHMMHSVLKQLVELHPLIKMYDEYITYTFEDSINSYHDKIFLKHNYDILWDADAQKYLCDTIVKYMDAQNVPHIKIRTGSSFGRPWTQIDIAEKKHGYYEKLFWRVDIRSGKFYIRLNQYSEPSEDEIKYKMKRLDILRKEANSFVSSINDLRPGHVLNKGIKESEVLIFFLVDNDLEVLLKAIPQITDRICKVFYALM